MNNFTRDILSSDHAFHLALPTKSTMLGFGVLHFPIVASK